MTIIQAILLGIIQGITEFIPISSTAHLTLVGSLLGVIDFTHPERWTAFIATIQLGSLLAVFAYFRHEIISIPKAFFKENFKRIPFKKQSVDSRLGWLIIFGSIPIGIIGIVLKDFIEGSFTKELNVIGISLIALALVLLLAEKTAKFKKDLSQIKVLDAIIIGFSQCLALIPGASRSGTTLTGAMFCGINRSDAAKFSFLLSIPAILASGLLSFYESTAFITSADLVNLSVATLFAGISGYWAISFLIKFLKTKTTMVFIIYRICLGVIVLIVSHYFSWIKVV
ncbi:MAG: undecaprenyl-diphosphatase UppP [bacterium]